MAPSSKSKKQNSVESPEIMVVNDIPGEECRIAILQDGHLGELYTERHATATDVGSIYKGRVVNVEPAIQAAFIDYGQGANGFLHISDLHPRYFPGEERTERVGKKIPRRERPSIQSALRRGQEILVQVLKEGIGTKGPTLTSYLSIPGRLLVMMPDMDRVGVSRKVEDEEKRREMRQILDSLNLPEGFGFILRTAGFGKTKTELKRDAAYLMRLWKVMEKRIDSVGAPCELYTESDLLIRTIRDVLRPSVHAIVVDSESAHDRVQMFLSVIAPRSSPRVLHYRRSAPIFHAFDIERQIDLIHAREVPLPSGGRLVIDQTEALVAIDVNSGRSRSARDSETNAYETNIEATDEICRQLRLRDLGGLIVNDLIDMRSIKHRRSIEERFTNNLKRDRARSTIAPISEFGILEMTRQRMRPSLRKAHFMACSHCEGRGEIKNPESVASDAVRHIGFLLQHDRVARVEVACSPRVASVMLSAKRRELVRLEDEADKRIDVRVSETISADRMDYYAYDERNADIDVSKLPALPMPTVEDLERDQLEPNGIDEAQQASGRGGRRRSRGRRGPADATAIALAGEFDEELEALGYDEETDDVVAGVSESMPTALAGPKQTPAPEEGGKRRRRRRRRRRRGDATDGATSVAPPEDESAPDVRLALDVQADADPTAQNVRVHELARELNVSTSELIERVGPEPHVHNVTSPLSSVTAEEADVIRHMFGGDAASASQPLLQDQSDAPNLAEEPIATDSSEAKHRRKRRRRGRRGRGGRQSTPQDSPQGRSDINLDSSSADVPGDAEKDDADRTPSTIEPLHGSDHAVDASRTGVEPGRRKRRRGRRRGKGGSGQATAGPLATEVLSMNGASDQPRTSPTAEAESNSDGEVTGAPSTATVVAKSESAQPKKRRRSLYRAGRGSVLPGSRPASGTDDE